MSSTQLFRTLGKDLRVSAVGLGCMGFSHNYGPPTEPAVAKRRMREAFDMGYTLFDSAEVYTGTNERGEREYNEELVGGALRDVRDQAVIASKFGISIETGDIECDASAAAIRRAVEGSLRRLGTDHIDLYYQHRMDAKTPPEEVASTMAELIAEGKVTHWGVCEATEDYVRRAHAVCPLTAVQSRYSMMARQAETLFPTLEELGIGFVPFSPLANGFLSGCYAAGEQFAQGDNRSRMPQYSAEGMKQNRALTDLLGRMAREREATSAQVALAWMLCKRPFIVPIPGSRRPERMRENLGSREVTLSEQEVRNIDEALAGMTMSEVFGGRKIRS